MASITNVNQNASVVNVGRTTPVTPGAQLAAKSIPVVMASDQTAIPVVEQNKVQSEVALSLLGIPRAEIALGIFADVNTYDVNPSEWSMKPAYHVSGDGIKHLPTEAGALVEASRNKIAVLTSKRFFRYQPGRVSAATFGIRSSVSEADFAENPVIRKYGIYDKYDGYYWETRNSGVDDNFTAVRRTQSLAYNPISPYGVKAVDSADSTPLRGENPTADVPATQIDDYRIVGLGAPEKAEFVGELLSDRQILQDNRYKFIDDVLNKVTAAYTADADDTDIVVESAKTSNKTLSRSAGSHAHNFYEDLAAAFNLAASDGLTLLTAAQMEAKCKRDLDYWIDNYLLDMKYGGNAHTKWNTTNFTLITSGATAWTGTSVGVFPKITVFEKPIHQEIHNAFFAGGVFPGYDGAGAGTGTVTLSLPFSAAAKAKLSGTDEDPGDADTGLTDITLAAFNTDTFAPQTSGITYGTRDALETFFDVKRNFWSYYVTAKKDTITTGASLVSGRKYTIRATGGNLSSVGAGSSPFVGQTFVANGNTALTGGTVCETIVYTAPTEGTSSDSTTTGLLPLGQTYLGANNNGAADDILEEIIANKCQRDVGYIIDGYKNDAIGGGDAETTYNASMFLRGTGMSVYSQREIGVDGLLGLSEPDRHEHLRKILKIELFEAIDQFGLPGYVAATIRDKVAGDSGSLAKLIVNNFEQENTKSCETGSKGFPGNLVALRDGLIHVHGAVYDPSLLKEAEKIKAIVTLGDVGTSPVTASVFKIVKGSVTFGQHVKLSWTGDATEIPIQSGGSAQKVKKGEVLRVSRVIGPKGNEFKLLKEGGAGKPPVALTNISTDIDTFYIETVVPFIFPKDYDTHGTIGVVDYTSEIDTTVATLTNSASTDNLNAGTGQRVFNNRAAAFDTIRVPKGAMFPYMYATEDDLTSTELGEKYIGFINTATDPQKTVGAVTNGGVDVIRSQIDNVNFYPEYVNWIKNNVKPEYWGVYEYRVPRSRFSHDALDGIKGSAGNFKSRTASGRRNRVFSDIATTFDGKTARPGANYLESEGVSEQQNSLYNFDFTKVTMLKIEFSWYGAVGALFLAYIPVGNGEARWVRVHHLRASNQLKIASLGNATLPITYTTYGGGDVNALGDGEEVGDSANPAPQHGYSTVSHNIVKYGASYYIDGGDRGTVRLYSHNNQSTVSARGKQFAVSNVTALTGTITGEPSTTPRLVPNEVYIEKTIALDSSAAISNGAVSNVTAGHGINDGDTVRLIDGSGSNTLVAGDYTVSASGATSFTLTNAGSATSGDQMAGVILQKIVTIDPTFYIGAKVKTDSALDQNVEVIWAQGANVFLSAPLNSTSGVSLLPDRSATVYGVETKKSIKSTREGNVVRNRVQVYPTKMSTANIGNDTVRLRFKKTPLFQTNIAPDETVDSSSGLRLSADYTIDNTNASLPVVSAASGYLQNGQDTYGWFRGRVESAGVTVFGRLYKEADYYYFELLESFEGSVTLINGGRFLADKKFQADGNTVTYTNTSSKVLEEKEGLSSVEIASNIVVPIANTGVNVATTYLRSGTEQFDLSAYFDYNKEYLSFPLTDVADTLYFAVDSDTASTNTDEISLGVTWEEQ